MARSTLRLVGTLLLVLVPVVHAQQPGVRELTAQDRAEIQELVTRYARALSSCASEEYTALFVPDGVFISDDFRGKRHRAMYGPNGGRLVGRAKLAELVETEDFCLDRSTTRAARPVTPPNVVIVATADGAKGTIALANDGRYEDEYVKTADGWRFKTRKVVMPKQQATKGSSSPPER